MFRHILLILLLLSLSTTVVALHNWPSFHGADRTNISTETGLLNSWPDDGPPLLRTITGIGEGYSSVAIYNEHIYTAGMIDNQTSVSCISPDGSILWQTKVGLSWHASDEMPWAKAYSGARATPTLYDGTVYFLSEMGELAALDGKSGDMIWSINVAEKYNANMPRYGYAESVLVMDDKVFCCVSGEEIFAAAFDRHTGDELWTMDDLHERAGNSSLVPADIAGIKQLVGFSSERVFSMNPENGALFWKYPFSNTHSNNSTDVIVHDGYVFASSGYGGGSTLFKPELQSDGSFTCKKIWKSELMDNHHGGVVFVNGYVFGSGHESKGWFCLDFMTGEQKWKKINGKGSLTYADGHLYCLDERGRMSLIKAVPDECIEISSFRLPKKGKGAWWAHPLVWNGCLYLRHSVNLYVYKIKQ